MWRCCSVRTKFPISRGWNWWTASRGAALQRSIWSLHHLNIWGSWIPNDTDQLTFMTATGVLSQFEQLWQLSGELFSKWTACIRELRCLSCVLVNTLWLVCSLGLHEVNYVLEEKFEVVLILFLLQLLWHRRIFSKLELIYVKLNWFAMLN